jgi:hypothetical protein
MTTKEEDSLNAKGRAARTYGRKKEGARAIGDSTQGL